MGSPYALSNEPKVNIIRCPQSPHKGGSKHKTAFFRVKSHFVWRKSATMFLCAKTVSDKVVRHSFIYASVYK